LSAFIRNETKTHSNRKGLHRELYKQNYLHDVEEQEYETVAVHLTFVEDS